MHLPGIDNSLADVLSRNNLPSFLSHCPQACPTPTFIPPALLDLVAHSKPDWTSLTWSRMFNSIFSLHSRVAPCEHMPQATAAIPSSAVHTGSSPTQPLKISYASSLRISDGSTSSTKPSSAICRELDSSTYTRPTQTHSLKICPDFTTFSEVSSPKRQKTIAHHSNAYQ